MASHSIFSFPDNTFVMPIYPHTILMTLTTAELKKAGNRRKISKNLGHNSVKKISKIYWMSEEDTNWKRIIRKHLSVTNMKHQRNLWFKSITTGELIAGWWKMLPFSDQIGMIKITLIFSKIIGDLSLYSAILLSLGAQCLWYRLLSSSIKELQSF